MDVWEGGGWGGRERRGALHTDIRQQLAKTLCGDEDEEEESVVGEMTPSKHQQPSEIQCFPLKVPHLVHFSHLLVSSYNPVEWPCRIIGPKNPSYKSKSPIKKLQKVTPLALCLKL